MTNPPDTSASGHVGTSAATPTPATAYTKPGDEPTSQLVAAFVDKNWSSHYKRAWMKLGSPKGMRKGLSWNWPAALFTFYWLLYRRQYLYAILWLVVSFVLGLLGPIGVLTWNASIVFFGMYGDRIILSRAYAAAEQAMAAHGPGDKAKAMVAAAGGVNKQLILVILVLPFVVIGLLAVIAIPKFAQVKRSAYVRMMRSDLTNLVTLEQTAFAANAKYTDDLGSFVPSNGVTKPGITLTGDSAGFVATVRHAKVGGLCAVAVNMPNPIAQGAESGEVVCR